MKPNTFLLSSRESSVKFWNIEKDKNYSLNLYNFISKKKIEKKLYVLDVRYDPNEVILYIALSNGEILVFKGRTNEIAEEENDWKKIGALNTFKNKNIS